VLLLDEPLSALDVQIREEMQEELSRLQRQLNITFVMVTHDQSEALALSSSVSVFNQGHIEQTGSPGEIYAAPQTAFVAKFIGRSNILAGTVVEVHQAEGEQAIIVALDSSADSGAPIRCNLEAGMTVPAKGSKVELCVKPEAVLPLVAGSDKGNTLPCKLESSAYQGSLADLRLNLNPDLNRDAGSNSNSGTIIRASVPAASLPEIASAQDLKVYIAPGDLRLLKSAAGGEGVIGGTAGDSANPSEAVHVAVS